MQSPSNDAPAQTVSFAQARRFWFKLGCISFGGPAGQIAIMHAELVEKRRWISEQRFLHALNYAWCCMVRHATWRIGSRVLNNAWLWAAAAGAVAAVLVTWFTF